MKTPMELVQGLLDIIKSSGIELSEQDLAWQEEAASAVAAEQKFSEWTQMGVVGVDAGMLMVQDPCYLESEWKGKGTQKPRLAEALRHKDGRILYCALHGGQPTKDAIPFGNWETKLDAFDGKTPNEMMAAGEIHRVGKGDPSGEFSYTGCCEAAGSEEQGGQLNFSRGHAGAGVVFSTGFGDGCYPVYVRYADAGDWGRRVAEAKIVMITPRDLDDEDEAVLEESEVLEEQEA